MNPDRLITRNLSLSVLGEAVWGIHGALTAGSTVLAVLLQDLGATEKMIGSIESIQKGLLVFPQLFGLYIFTSRKHLKRQLVLWHLVIIIPFIFLSGILIQQRHHFSDAFLSWSLLISFAAFFFFTGVVVSVWLDWQVSLFKEQLKGTALGLIFFASALIGSLSGVVAGWLLEKFPFRSTYAYLYFVAGIFTIISITFFWFIRDPAEFQPEARRKRPGKELLNFFSLSLKEYHFRQLLMGRLLGTLGFSVVPLIAIHFQSAAGGGLSSGTIVACGSAMLLGTAIAHLILGKLGDHFGHRLGLMVGMYAQIFTLLLLLCGTGKWVSILTYFSAGVNGSAFFLSHTNLLFESCRHENRLAHFTLGNVILSIPMLVAPILAGYFAEIWGLTVIFQISLFFSILAVLWFIWRVRDPRDFQLQNNVCSSVGVPK
jgi:MFS family permease